MCDPFLRSETETLHVQGVQQDGEAAGFLFM